MALLTSSSSGSRLRSPRLRSTALAWLGWAMLGLVAAASPPAGVRAAGAQPVPRRLPPEDPGIGPPTPIILRRPSLQYPNYGLFIDPDPEVVTKEFALYYNIIPDPTRLPGGARGLFHIVYQRSGGPQEAETLFG